MTTLDILYLSLSLGFLVLVGFLSYASYNLVITLRKINVVVDNVTDITNDVEAVKNTLKANLMNIVSFGLNLLSRNKSKK